MIIETAKNFYFHGSLEGLGDEREEGWKILIKEMITVQFPF